MSELTPLLSIRLMVSSSEWYLSLTDAKGPNVAHVSDIVWRLQRIVSLPREIIDTNKCSLSKIEFVEWKPLYIVVPSKNKGRNEGDGGDGDDDFGGRGEK